jgi:hypothetical protein
MMPQYINTRRHFFTRFLASLAVLVIASFFTEAEDSIDWAKAREFWSFQAPVRHQPPAVRNTSWPRQPMDYFVLTKIEARQLSPSPEAERRTLIRRLTFDLTGLPPTPEEIQEFLSDKEPDAYDRLAERLLASTRFGERMASLWLPLARYAEDQAHQVGDDTKFFYPNAYHYREWVINAFNHDLPYDRFIKMQLAADIMGDDGRANLSALGFLGLGPKYYNRGRLDVMADEWEDRVDTVSRTMLGLTVACARCHDHKYDPITQSDYYAMAGVFASTKMVNVKPGENGKDVVEEKADKEASKKTDPAVMHIVQEGTATNLNVFLRGNVERKGPVVERRFIQVLSPPDAKPFEKGSGRLELAEAIASPRNPLAARVIVNRVWGALFGTPLVATPSNFGHSGQPPTNSELLDDLSVRFMENGWSIKQLVREIVLSSTYRQSSGGSRVPPTGSTRAQTDSNDDANDLLTHMNRKRLRIEQWRDGVLFVSGELDWTGGKSLELDDPENHHRTVYGRVSRLKLNDFLMQFDYPDANVHAEKRAVTTTPMQKLFMLNSSFMLGKAKAFADRMTSDVKESECERVKRAYNTLYGRDPEKRELDLAMDYLGKPANGEMSRWERYAQVLLASNEMLYVD